MLAMNEAVGLDITRVSEGDHMLEEMRIAVEQVWELGQAYNFITNFDGDGSYAHKEKRLAYQLGSLLKLGGELAMEQGLEEPGSEKLLAEEDDAVIRRATLAYNKVGSFKNWQHSNELLRADWHQRIGLNWKDSDVLMWNSGYRRSAYLRIDNDDLSRTLASHFAVLGTIADIDPMDSGTVILTDGELREYYRENEDAEWKFDPAQTKQFAETRVSRMVIPVTDENDPTHQPTSEFTRTVIVLPVPDKSLVTTAHPTHF
jgi:hypothetical protein